MGKITAGRGPMETKQMWGIWALYFVMLLIAWLVYRTTAGRIYGFDEIVYTSSFWAFAMAQLFSFAVLLWALFIRHIGEGRFNYTMIACGGGALMVSCQTVSAFKVIFGIGFLPVLTETELLTDMLLHSGTVFVHVTFPFFILVSAALIVSNIVLIMREGPSVNNSLGIMMGLLIMAGSFLVVEGQHQIEDVIGIRWVSILYAITAFFLAFFECMYASTLICVVHAGSHETTGHLSYIVILGCMVRPDGTLTPLLRGRADAALRAFQKQPEDRAKKLFFIPSGGKGSDEPVSEGESITRYLKEQGIEEGQILPETKSVNTEENFRFSKEIIEASVQEDIPDREIAFATTNYHVFRSHIIAAEQGIDPIGIGSRTRWYFWPNAVIREFIGLLYRTRRSCLILLAAVMILFTAAAFFLT